MEIKGYVLEGDLQTTNGGNCKWGFAKKNGRRYFIKELLNPVYPSDDVAISDELKKRKRAACRTFEDRQKLLYSTLNNCSEGVLVHIEEFFRCGSKYYITMPAIRAEKGDVTKDPSISREDRIRICRSLIHSLARMHEAGLIHGDLKLDNVLITETSAGFYTPKVIDFEDCYWQKESPEPGTDIKCDMSYAAPETFRRMLGEDLQLTQAVDVFALGLLMHALLTGEFPRFDKDKFSYPFESLIKGEPLLFWESKLPDPYKQLIKQMLLISPEKRITLKQAEEVLTGHPVVYEEVRSAARPARNPEPAGSKEPVRSTEPAKTAGSARAVRPRPAGDGKAAGKTASGSAAAYARRPAPSGQLHMKFEPEDSKKPDVGLKINMGSGVRVSGARERMPSDGEKPVRRADRPSPAPRPAGKDPAKSKAGAARSDGGYFDSAGDL